MIKKNLRNLLLAGIEVGEHTTSMLAYWDQDLICMQGMPITLIADFITNPELFRGRLWKQ